MSFHGGNHHYNLIEDRDGTLEDIRFVLGRFCMPAQDLIPDWDSRGRVIVGQNIFSDRIFVKDVMRPVLKSLGINHDELKAMAKTNQDVKALYSAATH